MRAVKGDAEKILVGRKLLELPKDLFNEAAKPPYQHLFAMTDLGNMLFAALQKAGLNPLFRNEKQPIGALQFASIEVDVLKREAEFLRRFEEMQTALIAALGHVQELRDAWERGVISEHDGLGGTRSNRNVDVEVRLRSLLGGLDRKS